MTWLIDALALAAAAWVAEPIRFHEPLSLLAAVVLISLANALVRPIVVRFVIRYAVLTFGLLSLLINGLMIGLVATVLPGFEVGSFLVAFLVSLYLAVVNLLLGLVLDLDWSDSYYRQVVLELVRRERHRTGETRPGVVFVQVDGLSEPLLRFAIRTGNASHLSSWVRGGSHRIARWDVLLPSQTSASQAGILHGNNDDIPAFRWFEKSSGRLLVSNRPADAAEIERRVSSGAGLLVHGGSSVTNLLSGDASRSVLTNSTLLGVRGVRSRDFFGFFADPSTVFRTLALSVMELLREFNEARRQRLRELEPRIARAWPFPMLRVAACVLLRDVSVGLVLEDMYRGVPVIYVDLVGYDEVAHHAGPERPESLDAVAEVDRQIGIIARAAGSAPRPYHVVVLSDHGQSQGATFRQRFGRTLDELVRELMAGEPEVLAATSDVEGWGHVNTVLTQMAGGEGRGARMARRRLRTRGEDAPDALDQTPGPVDLEAAPARQAGREVGDQDVVVAASGNLANVYFTGLPGRATWEAIGVAHPGLVEALASHPGVGLVLVRSERDGPVVLGGGGMRRLGDGHVTGTDPLVAFGPLAEASLRRLDGFSTVGDLVVVSLLDPLTSEVAAFEELVGSHGGLGGAQTEAFILFPSSFPAPEQPIVGAPALHGVLVGWLRDLGLRGTATGERA
ncbi:MAG: hypothetical protein A2V85_07765 [Chloroflexi bacterium RBG_16_72_14]|nr:MAG: hypothetical protein A2V85_07765 [Chloroflexi bacterium RBG_16_72_14]